ncbi:plastid lipoate synthase 1 [Artemisia annua]|uniref:Plastid lipoate synthase 1 n=1 Tax=Artemisia annua TaxID=35608 RepID=A0A2U1P4L9_ARTAN|nr:plastid lipoate synthase 1 [Artemisia annua]
MKLQTMIWFMDGNSQFPSLGSIRLDVPTPTNENVLSLSCSVHYIVLISVDHDDLLDGGSGHFVETVRAMKKSKPEIMAECLTSDFQGDLEVVSMLANSGLDIFAHNIEIVNASIEIYWQSLSVLKHAKLSKEGVITKTSIMLGLGETDDELKEAMAHLRLHVQCLFEHYCHILKRYIYSPYSCMTFKTMNIIFVAHTNLILIVLNENTNETNHSLLDHIYHICYNQKCIRPK